MPTRKTTTQQDTHVSSYNPPFDDIDFCIRHHARIEDTLSFSSFEGMETDDIAQILDEAGKFARDVIAPSNVPGDVQGISLDDGKVSVPDEIAEALAEALLPMTAKAQDDPDATLSGFANPKMAEWINGAIESGLEEGEAVIVEGRCQAHRLRLCSSIRYLRLSKRRPRLKDMWRRLRRRCQVRRMRLF